MKHLLLMVALASLATTGCAGNRMMRGGNCCDDVCCSAGCAPTGWRSTFAKARQKARASICTDVCESCVECQAGCYGGSNCGPGGCHRGHGYAHGGGYGHAGHGHGHAHGHGHGHGYGHCGSCGGRGCGACAHVVGAIASGFCPHAGGYPEMPNFNPGPPTGQTAYPYYTVRGPRDFLQANPPSIGPY